MKIRRFGEIAYLIAMITLSAGAALMAKADFGVSIVVAPAYILYQKVSFLSYGMAEYVIQAAMLVLFCLVMRKIHWTYFLSFATALIYGVFLDGFMCLLSFASSEMAWRIVFYVSGLLMSSLGVAFFFRTYFPPEVYELFVKGVSNKFKISTNKFKIAYDITSCILSIGFSFLLFGKLIGIGWGSVLCALVNGLIITLFGKILDKFIEFLPIFPKLKRIISDREVTGDE